MFAIRFFRFNKRPNSTKRPSLIDGSVYYCNIVDSSSILTPIVTLSEGNNSGFKPDFNYAYIQEFNRYYFITDLTFNVGFWELTFKVDVLASYLDQINVSTQYVIRTSDPNYYDKFIIDNMYITRPESNQVWNYDRNDYEGHNGNPYEVYYRYYNSNGGLVYGWDDFFNISFNSGEFCVGIIGNNTTGVSYYKMTYSRFKEFINKAFTLVPSDMTDVSSGIANAIYDPIQYITFCRWYPVVQTDELYTSVTSVKLGAYTITLSGNVYKMDNIGPTEFEIGIDLPKHPQSQDRPYMNLSPFTEYNLFFPIFGNIPIDTTKVFRDYEYYTDSKLYITWLADYKKGMAHLFIKPQSHMYENQAIIYENIYDFGVDIPVSSLSYDWKAGLGLSALTWLKSSASEGIIGSLIGGKQYEASGSASKSAGSRSNDFAYTGRGTKASDITESSASINNTDVINSAMGVVSSALGQLNTAGTIGSFMSYDMGVPFIYAYFINQVDQDINRFGVPAYKRLNLQYLENGSYVICSNASMETMTSAHPFESEYDAIIEWLNSGIYIER